MAAGGHGEAAILTNLKIDDTVPPVIMAHFLQELSVLGNPGDCCEARRYSKRVVEGEPKKFLCSGRAIAKDRFSTLARLRKPKDVIYCMPETRRIEFLAQLGITEADLRSSQRDTFGEWWGEYEHELSTGGRVPISWVTEAEVALSAADHFELADRLGLEPMDWSTEDFGVLFCYDRALLQVPLLIPTSLDGIDFPRFKPAGSTDPCGETVPNSLSNAGMPEAVHHACEIPKGQYTYRIIP